MKQQHTLMKFDPATGEQEPYPSHADQWREWHGEATAWLFNPWSGERRGAGDVGSDTSGHLIVPPGEPVYALVENAERAERKPRLCSECAHSSLARASDRELFCHHKMVEADDPLVLSGLITNACTLNERAKRKGGVCGIKGKLWEAK